MTSSNIIHWGGLAAMLGGVFWVVWSLLGRVSFEAAGSPFADGLLLLAALLTLGGLVGLHALQGGNYGRIGRAGFYAAAVGLLVQALAALFLLMGSDAWEVTLQWLVAPVGSLIVLVGLVLYGAATLQARVLVRVGAHRGTAARVLHEQQDLLWEPRIVWCAMGCARVRALVS